MIAPPPRLRRPGTALLVVDLQERLLPVMAGREALLQNALRLIRGASALGLPIFVTEQYRKGIGPTVPAVTAAIPQFAPFEKLAFSALGAAGVADALRARGIADVLLCGIEAHVCVCQTGLDLLAAGWRPFVVADAVASRTPENARLGIERLRDAGAVIVSTEMALFELLERAGTEEFRQILALVK